MDLSQSLDDAQWPRVDRLCKDSARHVHQDTKERQTKKFNTLLAQGTQRPRPMLDHSKLIVNLSHRQLIPLEEEVLALGLSFAVTPRSIPVEEIIAETEATARRLDQKTAGTLRTKIAEVLKKSKPPKVNMSYKQRRAVRALRNEHCHCPSRQRQGDSRDGQRGLLHQNEADSPR